MLKWRGLICMGWVGKSWRCSARTMGAPLERQRYTLTQRAWFGGRLIEKLDTAMDADRLGSYRRTYPYGELQGAVGTPGEKFGTYWRDATGLDYAVNRYYSPQMGRFLSADPYVASGGAADPGSWNRYAYVGGDPVNRNDPKGLYWCTELDRYVGSESDCHEMWDPNSPWGVQGGDLHSAALRAREETTSRMRKRAGEAIDSLGSHCEEIFSGMVFEEPGVSGPVQTLLIRLGSLASAAYFYDREGLESGLKVSEAFGVELAGDPDVGQQGYPFFSNPANSSFAITFSVIDNGVEQFITHIALGSTFSTVSVPNQNALLVHELLRSMIGGRDQILARFGIILNKDEDATVGITEWLKRGKNGCENKK